MKKYLLFLFSYIFFFAVDGAQAQNVVSNGANTQPINFPSGNCVYNWTNNNTSIGLAASGTGNIPSFTAVNTGATAVTATITGTPVGSGVAYIVNAGSNTVSVINIASSTVIATISVGSNPNSVCVDPNYNEVYVINNSSNTVSVISTLTNTVTATIPVGQTPWSVTVSPDGSRAYVADGGDNDVEVINTTTNTIVDVIPVGVNPNALAISPDGSLIYVNNSNSVSVINTSSHAVVATIPVGSAPQAILITPDGSKVYEANYGSGNVYVISTATNKVTGIIPVGSNPGGGSMSPDGSKVYIANEGSNNVSVISTATDAVIATIAVGFDPWGISVRPDGSQIYVANSGSNNISVINAATNAIISNIPVGDSPYSFGNFFTGGMGCSTPIKYTITVKPTASSTPGITADNASGKIAACFGSASASPNVQQFTVSGINLTGGITATAPAGFEVSLASGSGYGNTVLVPQASGSVSNTVIYVRSAASATAGSIAGNVILTSAGAAGQNVAVTGIVNALPTVNAVSNQTLINGGATAAITFTGTGNAFSWVNDTPGIGLAANGTGDIASFNAVNNGNTPITATITVTPSMVPYAYVTNNNSNTVSVINTLTETTIPAAIPVTNPYGAVVSPDGARAYISSEGPNGIISIINTSTNKITGTITTGTPLGYEAISADGSKLYAVSSPNAVLVINTATNAVINTIPADNPSSIALSPDGSLLWSVNPVSGTVTVNNTDNNSIVKVITVGLYPLRVTLSADGSLAYVTVANANYISVINTANYTVVTTIPVSSPYGEVLSPDGSRLYVADAASNSVSVINMQTKAVIATIAVGGNPNGISITPDGSQVIVLNLVSNTASVISTANNTVIATIPVGSIPIADGNFISGGSNCSGSSTTFTITVNPSSPTITTTAASGIISACVGAASASPNIQQFTFSGSGLTGNVTVAAPAGFEISLGATNGFYGSILFPQVSGAISNTVIYVRSSATAPAGSISGNITLTSAGAANQTVAVAGVVNTPPTVNAVPDQTVNNGASTAAVNFTGTGNSFTWVNDTPGIGLAASGTGNIAPFNAINNSNRPVTATITALPITNGYAYLANMLYNSISVINTANNTVAATIPVGVAPLGVAISPDGSRVYVTNSGINTGSQSNTLSEISTANNTVIATVPVGPEPYGIVLSPDGSLAYIGVENFNFADYDNVAVLNTLTNTIVTYIPVGINPAALAINADGSRVYVANSASGSISVINTATNTVIANIAMDSPIGIVLSPDGKKLYATDVSGNTTVVVDVATNTVTGNIAVGSYPGGEAISPDGKNVYVANVGSNTVSVINTATNTVTATIPVASNPNGIRVSPDGTRVYAGSAVISTATNAVIATLPVPNASIGDYITAGTTCNGAPAKFTVTVNPSAPTIKVSGATGTISACAGSASASPDIQQFAVSGIGLTDNITITAPPGFEVSLATGSGYGTSTVIRQVSGVVNNTVVYVRSSAAASVGNITGDVSLSSSGAPGETVAVNGFINVIANASLTISVSANNICAGTPITFTAIPVNGGSAPVYQWLLNGNAAGTNSPTFTSNNLTNGDVVNCTMTSNFACAIPANLTSNSITINVTAALVPSVTIAASQNNICAGTAVKFTATAINNGATPVYQWLINGNNAGANSATFSSTEFANGDVVSCLMTSNAFCAPPAAVASNAVTMSVGPLVSPAISISASQNNICAGTNVIFTATVTNAGTVPVYQWQVNGNNAGANSGSFSSNTFSNGDIVTCTLTSNGNCLIIPNATANGITMAVNALAAPTISIAASTNNVCAGTSIAFTATVTNGGNSPVYQWSVNGNNAGTNSATFSSNTFANGDVVNCVLSSNATCATPASIASNNIIAIILPLPVVTAGSSKTIKKGNSAILTASTAGDIADITWSPATGLDNNKILSPQASPLLTTMYTITVKTTAGCTATDSVLVNVFDGITIPNTFTPNGDGINDKWDIQNLKDYQNCEVYVYDRYGSQVFLSKGYYSAWDGTAKGKPLPFGTYYYLINLNDGTPALSGFVALIK